jgi:hypothetical protein
MAEFCHHGITGHHDLNLSYPEKIRAGFFLERRGGPLKVQKGFSLNGPIVLLKEKWVATADRREVAKVLTVGEGGGIGKNF